MACRLAGLEPLNMLGDDSLFVNVGERTNVTGSAKFKQLIKEKYSEALDVSVSRWKAARRLSILTWTGMLDGNGGAFP